MKKSIIPFKFEIISSVTDLPSHLLIVRRTRPQYIKNLRTFYCYTFILG